MAQGSIVFSSQQMTVLIEHIRMINGALKKGYDLNVSEYCVLRALQLAKETVSGSDIIAFIGLSKSAVTEILLSLEDRGLIAKTEASDDRRKMLISKTERGILLSKEASRDIYYLLKSTFWKTISEQEITEVLMCAPRDHDNFIGKRPECLATPEWDEIPLTSSFLLGIIEIIKEWGVLIREKSGLTLSEFRILSSLSDEKTPLRLADISSLILIRKSNLTYYKGLLEEKGLIKSEESLSDRRSQVLLLTAKGEKLVKRLKDMLNEKNMELYYTSDKESNILNAWHMRMYCELDTIKAGNRHY